MRLSALLAISTLWFSLSGAVSAATIDFRNQNSATVSTSPLTSGDDQGLFALDLVGLEGRVDPENGSYIKINIDVSLDPGSTPQSFLDLYDGVYFRFIDKPDPIPLQTMFADAQEADGLFTASVQYQIIDIEPGLGFQILMGMYMETTNVSGDTNRSGVGTLSDAVLTSEVTASGLLPLATDGYDEEPISPVPLPAAAWILLAAIGSLFALSRRSP